MKSNNSPELQALLAGVGAALVQAGKNARQLAEQTGTNLVIVDSLQQQPTWSPHATNETKACLSEDATE